MRSKIAALFFSFLMAGSGLGVLISVFPVSSASAPSSSISNSVYLNGTLSGDQNFGTINSGHVVLNAKDISYGLSLNNEGSWTASSTNTYQYTWTDNLGSVAFVSGSSSDFSIWSETPVIAATVSASTEYSHSLYSVSPSITIGSTTYDYGVWTPNYEGTSSYTSGSSVPVEYWQYGSSISLSHSTGVYSVSLKVVIDTYDPSLASGGSVNTYSVPAGISTGSFGGNPTDYIPFYLSDAVSQSDIFTSYTYSGASATSPTLSVPSNLVSWDIVNSNVPSGVSASASGIQTSNFATSIKFTGSSSTSLSSTSYTIDYATENAIESESQSFGSGPISQNPLENQNWWNSSFSYKITPPSSWENSASYPTKLTSYTVQHILSAGYGTSPAVDIMEISGSHSATYNFPSQYESFTVNPSSTENSAFTLSFNIAEFINYQPNTPTITTSYSGSGSTANVQVVTGEQITGEHENILINWGDGTTTPLNNVAFGTQPIQSHTYSGTYQGTFSQSYSPTVTVTNLPNGNPSGNTVQTNSATSSPYTFGLQDNPTTPNSEITKGQYIWLNITATNLQPSSALFSSHAVISTPLARSVLLFGTK